MNGLEQTKTVRKTQQAKRTDENRLEEGRRETTRRGENRDEHTTDYNVQEKQ